MFCHVLWCQHPRSALCINNNDICIIKISRQSNLVRHERASILTSSSKLIRNSESSAKGRTFASSFLCFLHCGYIINCFLIDEIYVPISWYNDIWIMKSEDSRQSDLISIRHVCASIHTPSSKIFKKSESSARGQAFASSFVMLSSMWLCHQLLLDQRDICSHILQGCFTGHRTISGVPLVFIH